MCELFYHAVTHSHKSVYIYLDAQCSKIGKKVQCQIYSNFVKFWANLSFFLTVGLFFKIFEFFQLFFLAKVNFWPFFKQQKTIFVQFSKLQNLKKALQNYDFFENCTFFSDFSSLWDAVNPNCRPEFRLDIQPHTIHYYQTREKMSFLSIII